MQHSAFTARSNRRLKLLTGVFLLALTYGCGGTLFKVKPVASAPMPEASKTAESNGVLVKALPVLSDLENQEMFEANLPLGGILPVRLEIVNSSAGPLSVYKAHFTMRDASGGEWKLLTLKQLTTQIMKSNDIVFFSPAAKRKFSKDLEAYSFDMKTVIGEHEHRQGFLFFRTPRKGPVENPQGLILKIDHSTLTLQISLT